MILNYILNNAVYLRTKTVESKLAVKPKKERKPDQKKKKKTNWKITIEKRKLKR